MSRTIVVGSINMDVVLKTENMLKSGETVLGNGLNFIPGGKGANQTQRLCASTSLPNRAK